MKKAKVIIGLTLIFSLGFLSGFVCKKHFRRGGPFGKPKPKDMVHRIVKRLTYELNLSKDQATEIKGIFLNNHKKIREIHEKLFPQIGSIRKDTIKKVDLVLNKSQKEKFKNIQKRFLKLPHRRHHRPPPPL